MYMFKVKKPYCGYDINIPSTELFLRATFFMSSMQPLLQVQRVKKHGQWDNQPKQFIQII